MIVDKNGHIPNTLSAPSTASFIVRVKSREDLVEVNKFARSVHLPLIPLGEGSNIVPRSKVRAVVTLIDIRGVRVADNTLSAQAGEKWDDVVSFAVQNNLSGIEALSWIPGLSGSAPVQNIGAYGTEISDVIEQVEVFDTNTNDFRFFTYKECQFEYRNSIFKRSPGKFIVTSITLRLSNQKPNIPKYKDTEAYFAEKNITNPSLLEIREAIISIRKNKLPDPSQIPNAGSYFTNPVLSKNKFEKIKNEFQDIPSFEMNEKIKIPAGWLIEQSSLKGKEVGKLKTHNKNALVLTNPNKKDYDEIQRAEQIIRDAVFTKFNIKLEREPIII